MKLALNLEAELLSPTERILATPKFHYLAISDADEVHPGQNILLACWRKTCKCSGMGPIAPYLLRCPSGILSLPSSSEYYHKIIDAPWIPARGASTERRWFTEPSAAVSNLR